MSPPPTNNNTNNLQMMPAFFQNAATFNQMANFQSNQGNSSIIMSKQQKNQQSVSFSSNSQQISKTMQQSINRN